MSVVTVSLIDDGPDMKQPARLQNTNEPQQTDVLEVHPVEVDKLNVNMLRIIHMESMSMAKILRIKFTQH